MVRAAVQSPPREGNKPTDRPASPQKRSCGKSADDDPDARGLVRVEDLVDPLMRSLGVPVAMGPGPVEPRSVSPTVIPGELETLISRMAKKLAWGTDGRRATACLQLGAGPLEGATVLLATEGRAVELAVDLPPGVYALGWEERIRRRFEERGFELTRLVVR